MPARKEVDPIDTTPMLVLCHMLASANEIKPDKVKLAELLGLSHPKNVVRKVNTIIGPLGFTYMSDKVTRTEDFNDEQSQIAHIAQVAEASAQAKEPNLAVDPHVAEPSTPAEKIALKRTNRLSKAEGGNFDTGDVDVAESSGKVSQRERALKRQAAEASDVDADEANQKVSGRNITLKVKRGRNIRGAEDRKEKNKVDE